MVSLLYPMANHALAYPPLPEMDLPSLEAPHAGPSGAPESPLIEIERAANPAHVRLFWGHLGENEAYDLYRSPAPYFAPGVHPAVLIQHLGAGGYGSGSVLEFVDDGSVGSVQVVGDIANNYFWAAEGLTNNGSGFLNYVGEFDFALVKGT